MDVPSGMVELVSRAICKAEGYDPDYEGQHGISWKEFGNHARAAIEAMMEPSDRMLDAGMREVLYHDADRDVASETFLNAWQAALRTALSPSLKEQERT